LDAEDFVGAHAAVLPKNRSAINNIGGYDNLATSMVVDDGSVYKIGDVLQPDPDLYTENLLITNIVGNTLTVTRGYNSTTPSGISDGTDMVIISAVDDRWLQVFDNLQIRLGEGPGSRRAIRNPKTNFQDWLEQPGWTLEDYFSATAGMIGILFSAENSKVWVYSDSGHIYIIPSSGQLGFQLNGGFVFHAAYTPSTWRACVVRWDGSNKYIKMNGGAWASAAGGTLSSMAELVRWLGDGISAGVHYASAAVTYDTQSEAAGDALLTYLIDLMTNFQTPISGYTNIGTFRFANNYTAGATSGDIADKTIQPVVTDFAYNPDTGECIKFTFVSGDIVGMDRGQLQTTAQAISSASVWTLMRIV